MIKDLLKKQEEEWKTIFYTSYWDITDPNDVFNWHKQSIRELLLAQIEEVEGMEATEDGYGTWQAPNRIMSKDIALAYNSALSDLRAKLKEQLKELE